MFETEVQYKIQSSGDLPTKVLEKFAESAKIVSKRTLLVWGEHCTECMFPYCYKSCELYTPREDGNCRLFAEGIVRLDFPKAVSPYLMKVTYKKWGRLFAFANTRLYPIGIARVFEYFDLLVAGFIKWIPLSAKLRIFFASKRSSFKKHILRFNRNFNKKPQALFLECYNPGNQAVPLSVVLRHETSREVFPFEHLWVAEPGYNREIIPAAEIEKRFSLLQPIKIEITPNFEEKQITLIFGCLEFITGNFGEIEKKAKKAKKIKCIVWDLDNTLWNGTLIEDGVDNLTLQDGVGMIIRELDKRGILHSVASKNNYDEAINAIKRLGLQDYFLYPQISWEPKSQAIEAIAKQLNIGIDTFLFIDDQPFEREEVKSAHPGISVMDSVDLKSLLEMPELSVPVTEESKNRRKMYQDAVLREQSEKNFTGKYSEFLKSCNIKVCIRKLDENNITRVYELAQRTNQMNFSGNRYEKDRLHDIMRDQKFDTYVIECEDKFGSYGIVGFGLIKNDEPRLIDLMFSCRIQSKQIEHTFIRFLLRRYFSKDKKDFIANFRKTDRNAMAGRVFSELGFVETCVENGITILQYNYAPSLPADEFVEISYIENSITV